MHDLNISVMNGRLVSDVRVDGDVAYLRVANNRIYGENNDQMTSYISWKLIDKRTKAESLISRLKKGALVSLDGRQETYNKEYFVPDGEGFKKVPVTVTINTVSGLKIMADAPSNDDASE